MPQQPASAPQGSQLNQHLTHNLVGLTQGPIMAWGALPPAPQLQSVPTSLSILNLQAASACEMNQPQEANGGKGKQAMNNSQESPTADSGMGPIFSLMSTQMSQLIAAVNASSEAHNEDLKQLCMEFNGLIELNHQVLYSKLGSSGTQASSQAQNEPIASRPSRRCKQPPLEDRYHGQPGHTKFWAQPGLHQDNSQQLPYQSITFSLNAFQYRGYLHIHQGLQEESRGEQMLEYIELSLFLHLHYVKDVYANSKKSQEVHHARLRSTACSMHKTRLYTSRADCVMNDDRLVIHNDLMWLIGSQGVSSDESDMGLEGQKTPQSFPITAPESGTDPFAVKSQGSIYQESWLMSLLPSERRKLKARANKLYNFESGKIENVVPLPAGATSSGMQVDDGNDISAKLEEGDNDTKGEDSMVEDFTSQLLHVSLDED
ncbi:hypothetical protein EDC04DRAFT_2902365 [Pisolithus marmoratus]|nr:hypothetical protein EDC04DRAFT_2902365 [Pisolithus marmoratus]